MGRFFNSIQRFGWLCLVAGSIVNTGCTRKADVGSVEIKVPIAKKVGALSTYELDIAILNVKIPGRPTYVDRIETHDKDATPISATSDLTFKVPDVPVGAVVSIQVLCVYRNTAVGDLKFNYGEASPKVTANINVTITATSLGTSTGKEAELAGRYLTSANAGPTGTLLYYFDIGSGKDPMIVERSSIVNGWFQAFAVQGVNFDMVVEETGQKLFDNLTVDAAGSIKHTVSGAEVAMPMNTWRLDMKRPAGFRLDRDEAEPIPETRMILGYFDNANDSLVNAGKSVVFPNVTEGIPHSFVNAAMTTKQDYTGNSGADPDVRRVAGGVSDSLSNVYKLAVTDCGQAEFDAGNCLLFYHSRLGFFGREGFSGMSPPFRIVRPFSRYGGYIQTKFQPAACSGQDCIKLSWDLLPGAGDALSEIEIWSKYSASPGGDDGGGHDETCSAEELNSKGYSKVASIVNPASTETYDFTSASLNSGNHYNYSFFLCSRMTVGSSSRYVGRPLRADCENCSDMDHFGWAPSTTNTTLSSSNYHWDARRVTGVPIVSHPMYTEVPVAGFTGEFTSGQEVLIHISGVTASSCGPNKGAGTFAFARVIEADTGASKLRIAKGTFLDDMTTVSGAHLTNDTNTGADFCYVQVVSVRHYNDLTLNASATLEAGAFNFMDAGAGILPVRVSGILMMGANAKIHADSRGYGAPINSYHGGSFDGGANNTIRGQMAGGGGIGSFDYGGGGGGLGSGGWYGSGPHGVNGSGMNYGGGFMRLMFGASGGGPGSSAGGAAGAGGGIVFLMAKKLVVADNAVISADGGSASGGGGAGGAGSVFVMTRKLYSVSGTDDLIVTANGGAAGSGGVGGKGSVTTLICANEMFTTANFVTAANVGTGTSMVGADVGINGLFTMSATENHLCRMP